MDLNALTALVIDKFKDAGGYSELSDQQLFKSIFGYLDRTYYRYFQIAKKKIEDTERDGIFVTQALYKKEYEKVEDIVMEHANKIAAVNKSEV